MKIKNGNIDREESFNNEEIKDEKTDYEEDVFGLPEGKKKRRKVGDKKHKKRRKDHVEQEENVSEGDNEENIQIEENTKVKAEIVDGLENNNFENCSDEAFRKNEEDIEKLLVENEHLRDLKIIIPFEVPLSHQIETGVGVRPSKEVNERFKKLDFTMKVGPFTKTEDTMIQDNFREFCKQHNLKHDPTPFLQFTFGGRSLLTFQQRLKFIQYIGKGLDDRKLHTIYLRFQKLNSKVQKGKFTTREDKIILDYVKNNKDDPQKFSSLAKILNRTRAQILKRYYTITQIEDFTKIPTRQKIEELVSALLKVFEVTTVKELKQTKIEDEHWRKISSLLDDIPVHYLKAFWNLSVKTRLFNRNIKINKVIREIIERIYQEKVRDWKQLNWQVLVKPYEHKHYTSAYVYSKFKDLRRKHVPEKYHDKPRRK